MRVPWPREAAALGVSVGACGPRRGPRGPGAGGSPAAARPVGLPRLRGSKLGVGVGEQGLGPGEKRDLHSWAKGEGVSLSAEGLRGAPEITSARREKGTF